jgi:hypothetical protein
MYVYVYVYVLVHVYAHGASAHVTFNRQTVMCVRVCPRIFRTKDRVARVQAWHSASDVSVP